MTRFTPRFGGEDASCFWSGDGKRLIAAARDEHGLRLTDWETDRELARLATDEDFDEWDLSPDGRWLATSKGALRLWDLHAGRIVAELQPDWFALAEPHFSPDGRFLAALDRQTTPPGPRVLRMWNLDGLVRRKR